MQSNVQQLVSKPYEAGSGALSVDGAVVELTAHVRQLLVYPTEDSTISINGFDEIFLPKGLWTPINFGIDYTMLRFTIRSTQAGNFHWQGWVV